MGWLRLMRSRVRHKASCDLGYKYQKIPKCGSYVFPQEGGGGVGCCKGVSWLPQRRGRLGGGGCIWIFFPGPLLDPRMRLACIKRILHLLIKFFLQDFLSTYWNIGYFFTGNIKTPKQSFFVFFLHINLL